MPIQAETHKFCCHNMSSYIVNDENLPQVIEYVSSSRCYSIILHGDPRGTHQLIWYCPWCGTKLPEDLGDEWGRILEEEYGINDPFDEDKERVPPEFWTDEWWKKRGL